MTARPLLRMPSTTRSVAIVAVILALLVGGAAFAIGRSSKDTAPPQLTNAELRLTPRPATGGVIVAPRRLRIPNGVGR